MSDFQNNQKTKPFKVAIFEDNFSFREVLSQLLNDTKEFICTGAFSDTRNIIEKINESQAELVIMDIDMPFVNGIESTQIIKEANPQLPVLILTVFEDEYKIYNAICAGANGYLLKNSNPEKILESIHEIRLGGAPMSTMVARKVLDTFKQVQCKNKNTSYNLSSREIEILELLTKGLNYKMIAEHCFISIDTVKYHAKNIYEKLHVHSKSEAIILAINQRIV